MFFSLHKNKVGNPKKIVLTTKGIFALVLAPYRLNLHHSVILPATFLTCSYHRSLPA